MPKVAINVSDKQIQNMLCNAFEGGSNYWIERTKYDYGTTGLKPKDFSDGGKMQDPKDYFHPLQIVPITEGCAVLIKQIDEDAWVRLDRAAIEKGCQVMAEKFPQHFADWMGENDDATTGDVFLQCCVFGELVYG